eukprot:scaffold36966_cov81-Attheya_sp.AAC.2
MMDLSRSSSSTNVCWMESHWHTKRFRELQRMVKENRTTDTCIELKKEYLVKQQLNSSNKGRCIRYRTPDICSLIENDLAEDLGDEIGQTAQV